MPYDKFLDAFDKLFIEYKKIASKNSNLNKYISSLMIKKYVNILKYKNDTLKIENATLNNASHENVYLNNYNIILNKKLK